MKKESLILGFMLVVASIMSHTIAAETYRSVVVTAQSGEVYGFSLDGTGVKAAFSGDKLVINNSTNQVELSMTETARFEFSTEEAGAKAAIATDATFAIHGATLSVSGLQAGSQVAVYNIAGQTVAVGNCDEQGSYSTRPLGKGIYIASTDKLTFKFIIK